MTIALAEAMPLAEARPGDVIGYWAGGEPIRLLAGAAEDDDADDDPDEDEPDDEDENDDEKVSISKAELEELRRGRSKANKEAMQRRRWLEEHNIDHKTGKRRDADDEAEDDEDDDKNSKAKKAGSGLSPRDLRRAIKREVEKEVTRTEMRYKAPLAKMAAESALAKAGYAGKNPERIMRLIDLDEIEVDEDGTVTGVEDQIREIKADFPEWFRKGRRSRDDDDNGSSAKDVDGGNMRTKDDGKQPSLMDQRRAMLSGKKS